MRLDQYQKSFKTLMLQAPKALESPDADFAALFHERNAALTERLKIYRNNITGSLTDALVATFPLLKALTGEDFLKNAARTFILDNPPRTGCLNLYGAEFDVFLAAFPPAQPMPYLPDIARLEIAINESYYAPDDDALRPDDLGAIPQENLADTKLPLRASAHLIESRFPLDKIRMLCLDPENQTAPDIDKDGGRWLILRPALEVRMVPLENDNYLALSLLAKDATLGEATEKTLKTFPDFDLPDFLLTHINLGTFQKNRLDHAV